MISTSLGHSVFDQPVEVPKVVKHDQGSPKLGQGPTRHHVSSGWVTPLVFGPWSSTLGYVEGHVVESQGSWPTPLLAPGPLLVVI
jgi:hypothetical protein